MTKAIMVRFHWLLLSVLSTFLFCLPAQAGRLLFWRFESNQNRLVFTTDNGVQPSAQLIFNPTRVVIDLPGIVLGRPNVNQPIGGTITSVRAGQFNAQTTRLVIELAPGYTINPQEVKIRGLSPTQWTVDLPTPQQVSQTSQTPAPVTPAPTPSRTPAPVTPTPTTQPQPSTPSSPAPATSQANTENFQVTRNGIYIRGISGGDNRKIQVQRSRDRTSIEFELEGASLPASLVSQTIAVNNYGISNIEFTQDSSPPVAHITLTVSKDSPDWQAVYSRFGGLVLLPRGGFNALEDNTSQPPPRTPNNTNPIRQQAVVETIELTNNNTQLLIRANQSIRGTGSWNRETGMYEIKIPNAQLADPVKGPQLDRNSPVSQLRIRQQDAQTVVILVKPALGVQLGQLNQANNQLLALDLRSTRAVNPTPPRSITVSPPPIKPFPPVPGASSPSPTTAPSTPLPRVGNGRVLVFIDPGHGGKDPGAIGIGGLQEKDVILPISLYVSQFLQQQGVQVMMARNSDYFVTLGGRTDMANKANANLFVSIHANSMGKGRPDVNGLEVYYYGNRRLADTIHKSILRSVKVRDRGVRSARFYVLKNSKMPSTLVEVGFVTGAQDSPNLRNSTYQRQMAEAIARGILDYIQQYRL